MFVNELIGWLPNINKGKTGEGGWTTRGNTTKLRLLQIQERPTTIYLLNNATILWPITTNHFCSMTPGHEGGKLFHIKGKYIHKTFIFLQHAGSTSM